LEKGSSPFEAFVAEFVDYADAAFIMSGTGEYFWAEDVVTDGGGENQTYLHGGVIFLF
jgi:hypothetical protein